MKPRFPLLVRLMSGFKFNADDERGFSMFRKV